MLYRNILKKKSVTHHNALSDVLLKKCVNFQYIVCLPACSSVPCASHLFPHQYHYHFLVFSNKNIIMIFSNCHSPMLDVSIPYSVKTA